MFIRGIVDWPFVTPNSAVKVGDVTVGKVIDSQLADEGMVDVTIELFPASIPAEDPETGSSFFRQQPWEPIG